MATPDIDGQLVVDDSKLYVRYGFENDIVAENLLDIVVHGIARWKPTTLVNPFDIVPEVSKWRRH